MKRGPRTPHPDLTGLRFRLQEALEGHEQRWLSERSGVEESGITRIIGGKALVGVTADTVIRLSRALGVSPGWLLAGDGVKRAVWHQSEVQPEPAGAVGKKRGRSVKNGN